MRVLSLGSLATLLLAVVSCETYEPPVTEYEFHASFTTGVAHEEFGCDACHVAAASLMLEQPADAPGSNWVTQLEVSRTNSCESCHPYIRNGKDSPEATVDCASLPLGDALRTSERCAYELAGVHQNNTLRCTESGCHSLSNTDWKLGGGGGPTGEPGPSHDAAPLLDVFPLEGGHAAAGVTCTDCHSDLANTANERGKSESCASAGCHSRLDPGVPGGTDHYPAAGEPESTRDCRACHVNYVVGVYTDYGFTWPTTFQDRQADHGGGFVIDHGDGANTCWNCHNRYENDNGSESLPTYFEFQTTTSRLSCLTCHEVGDGVGAISPRLGHGTLDQDDCKSCHANGTAAGE